MGKIVVVGSGWAGTVIARQLAENGQKIEMVEKRPHIAGNMYDEIDENGILIQRYGPHYFCTNHFEAVSYVKKYHDLFDHVFSVTSYVDGKYICCPYNFTTVRQLMGDERAAGLFKKFRGQFKGCDTVSMYALLQCGDTEIEEYANLLFEKVFKNYVAKMWGLDINTIDRSVVDRTQVFLNFSERKAALDFYFLPVGGFTEVFKTILRHENIRVTLNEDALAHIKLDEKRRIALYDGAEVDCLVFTGPIDELLQYKYGVLPYRSLNITYEHFESDSVLPTEVVYYPQADGYTRKTEYRKLMPDQSRVKGSVLATEYPLAYNKDADIGNEPYYPVLTAQSREMYDNYYEEARKYKNIFLCGRLANFRYYDMDACILKALETADAIKEYLCRRG